MRFPSIRTASALPCLAISIFLVSAAQAQDKPGWKLVWSDEFTEPAINASKWSFEVGPANVNSELEYYSNAPRNAFIENGSLVLRAIKENVGGRNYTSAKLHTRRKGDWLYGRIEVRAKLNRGKGLWPAIWMMPTDNAYGGWPSSGEMDIMESLGHQSNRIYATVHWNSGGHQMQGSNKTLASGSFADDYHVFGYEWDAGVQRWYLDDVLWFTTTRGHPFDKRFYLILNVAVGGSWPGNPDGTTIFPNDMAVDYVRVFEKSGTSGLAPAKAPQGFSMASNPFQDEVILANGRAESEVTIRNLSGSILEQRRLSPGEKQGFGKEAPRGVYLLDVVSGGQRQTARLFKSR